MTSLVVVHLGEALLIQLLSPQSPLYNYYLLSFPNLAPTYVSERFVLLASSVSVTYTTGSFVLPIRLKSVPSTAAENKREIISSARNNRKTSILLSCY